MILVKQATGSEILAGMAFGIGLLALKLAHSELFTEEFLLPLNAVIAGQATWLQVVRLWVVTLVTNLLGGAAFAWLIVLGLPDRSEEHTSELQSRGHLVCRLLLEKKRRTKFRRSWLGLHVI